MLLIEQVFDERVLWNRNIGAIVYKQLLVSIL